MISRLETIDNELVKYLIKLSGKIDFETLLHKSGLTRNELLSILSGRVSNSYLIHNLSNLDFFSDKLIVISDTHFGSVKDEIRYLELVYDYAVNNNITNIIHAGDLIQSTIKFTKFHFRDEFKQLEFVINNYPQDSNITNHILFGNHDFHTLKKDDEYIKVLESRKDFNILGFKRAYFKWNNYLMNVFHEIDNYKLNIPNVDTNLRLVGHKHMCEVNKNNVYVPTLSNDIKVYGDKYSLPGFLSLEIINERLNVIYHKIDKEEMKIINENTVVRNKTLCKK